MMKSLTLGAVPPHRVRDVAEYEALYRRSIDDPQGFWAEQLGLLHWFHPPYSILDADPEEADFAWFSGGKLNVAVNCVDRHAAERPHKVALVWVKNEPGQTESTTFRELKHRVGKIANVLRANGVGRGDRVAIHLPMMPELVYTMLACARIGAVHSVVYAGFSADALRERIIDAGAKVLITANEAPRGHKRVAMKRIADQAVDGLALISRVLVVQRTDTEVPMRQGRDLWLHEEARRQRGTCPAEWMSSEDPFFILHTSGSTGKPKGLLHTTAGYLIYAAMTHRWVFDLREGDVHLCTADLGWITGHTYVVYGPLANGATTVLFEPPTTHPDPGRLWQTVDALGATSLYTTPTTLRTLMREGDEPVKRASRASLRILATTGEPINPAVWRWFHEVVGDKRCDVLDTWWQAETGGIMMTPLPGLTPLVPGSVTRPFFGVWPVLVGDDGDVLAEGSAEGNLCLAQPWPGQARTLWGDHQRFREIYYSKFPEYYFTGDGCHRDEDENHWITGRVDDVLNVAGHRIGTAEIESAVVAHEAVAEAAAVGVTQGLGGQRIFVFAVLRPAGEEWDRGQLVGALKEKVRNTIGPFAMPDDVQIVSELPKTRSGKIMRRLLRRVLGGASVDELGDLTTLANPTALEALLSLPPVHHTPR
jgi:acetyl-CoA synthetase